MAFDIHSRCKELGIQYVSGYINAATQFKFIASCGHQAENFLRNVKSGAQCSSCVPGRLVTEDQVAEELLLYGMRYVSDWTNTNNKFYYLCDCGNLNHGWLGNIRRGFKCDSCSSAGGGQAQFNKAKQHWIAMFATKGCEILEYRSSIDIYYKCSCGGLHTTASTTWSRGRSECPWCREYWNANPDSLRDRPYLGYWRKEVFTRDNHTCLKCKAIDNLHAHHIEAYYVRPDLATEVNNGATLCEDCHRELHKLFGWNVGQINLEEVLGCSMINVN